MRNVYITAGNILTGAGRLDSTWNHLIASQTALRVDQAQMNTEFPLGIIPELIAPIGTAARLEELLELLFDDLPKLPQDTPLICATTKGAIDELLTDPTKEGGQVWQLADQMGARLGLTGHTSVVSAACASGTIAAIQAAMLIKNGEYNQVLVIGFDILSHFVVGGFTSLQGLSPSPCKPFDSNRDGLSLGEGAGWLLLSSEKHHFSDSRLMPCKLESWSTSCDATHITAPCRNGSGLIRVLDHIISRSSTPIGGVNAHGTGTVYNDAMEILAFENSLPKNIPINSVKGCIGHCLGGAGCIEIALSMKSLQTGLIPPTVGLINPEESSILFSGDKPLDLLSPSVLSCNSGFGGINAAVLLSQ